MMGVKVYLLDSFACLRTSLFCLILKANFLLIFLLLEYVLFELFIMDKYYPSFFLIVSVPPISILLLISSILILVLDKGVPFK